MIKLKRINKENFNVNTVLFYNKTIFSSEYNFSSQEKELIQAQIEKNGKSTVVINRYPVAIIVIKAEKSNENYSTIEKYRKAGAALLSVCNEFKINTIQITDNLQKPDYVLAVAEGMMLANYRFAPYKLAPDEAPLKEILLFGKKIKDIAIQQLAVCCEAVYVARDLVNKPLNYLNAEQLAGEFIKMGKDAGFKTEVMHKSKIESLKMGGLLAVNKGSVDPPTFTVMEYKPKKAKNKKPIVLVGKGVVYDTGGLSLKPTPNSMDYMKCDMAGAAVVAAAVYAVAKAKLPYHVIALVPATDNRPGMNAYVPGDVITMMSGLKVEMLNADAEGRMILADALHYAKKYNPELVLEFSTLTGAAKVAIGSNGIVCMGTANEKVKNKLKNCGNNVYERLAEFPFWEEYDEMIKSDIADIKNVGGAEAGAITAGKFLTRFTDYPFLHFDIAGPAFLQANDGYRKKGATAAGVRLLFNFFNNK